MPLKTQILLIIADVNSIRNACNSLTKCTKVRYCVHMQSKFHNFSYTVFYEAAPEGGFVALVPTLPGCHSQGDTLEEAERNIKEAIELYVESLIANNEQIPQEIKTYSGTVQISGLVPS